MSFLRKAAHLLTMLACVSLSAWAIGCGGATDDGVADGTSNADMGAGGAGSSETSDGGEAGEEPPPMPDADTGGTTETE